ncbi:MAG: vitamin B12-dependent ribonucleotide reductase [Actinomycetota bacterium]|nr:vitamin B12-dependent ribonucleotide reductase [Actinomycetota bacterium]
MTDSTKSATTRAGLTVERLYTTPRVHPYDEVTWERRDVVQTNWRTGDTVFEQRGVEFPDFWSVNASTIVTSKYFRGAVGSDERESSLRQLIDRVVLTYVKGGRDNGYFATPDDAEVFEHELTWMLLHQVFSFNSPVWFNVGTSSPQQVSACQPYHALVSTPDGLVPIGKLVEDNAVGAKVYDAHGLTRVLAVKANGVKDVLRLHTKAGYTLDVTADHLVWRSSDDRGSGSFVEAGTLRPGDKLEWHRRDAHGEAEIEPRKIAEAALAGWMQSDGFVGQYDGSNRSLTLEAMTVTPAELAWVTDALDAVFPGAHRHERAVVTQDASLDCRRTRLYGKHLTEFVASWGLRARGVDMMAPEQLFTAPLPVVAAYLRSVFQAEGFVSARERSTVVEVDMISEKLIRGMQSLLLRFGIFSRVGYKADRRADRKGCWTLRIQNAGDRRVFADEIGFIDERKAAKLERSFDLPGMASKSVKRLEIASVESLGSMEVFDVQTESGEYLSGNLRVHNCFILAVDDNMDSILNWYREEGLIFKGGSGSGLNISKIRSSKELLRSSGGTASGPVSFMRGADASAGTIKSGGATRRAAKMVVLDVDHPDIAEFVATKAREEDKIRVLRDAGFDMDLGGHDISSVQYQNANNSVRVTDEFMRAVEEGSEFALRGRLTGEVIETVDAKQLWGDIAQAAWECADPGVQYDGTINDWHTTPESGRITASNPCCFTGDTLVSTEQGAVEFDLLTKMVEAGETVRVLTRIDLGGSAAFSLVPVSGAWVAGEADRLVEVATGRGLVLRCTPEHRFLTDAGWVEARALKAGQQLVSDYELDSVASVRNVRLHEPVRVYDLEVPGSHNFVVESGGLPGVVVHNSEYMHLDNSSCNLASLNLMKFLADDGSFDSARFAKAVEFVITAMDISICFADFPTEKIGETTRAYRQLGIGYANLGALLMASGLAYDSEGGRALAASITSLMTGAAYKRSAELAGVVGPYDGYARNATAHTRVMRKHQAANDAVRAVHRMDTEVHATATKAWADGLAIGAENGWRNAQASVIAPTGTIAFMLDADTTGIEPDFSLVKFKKLVGGGSMQIVNQTVPRALAKLGYQDEQIEAIVEYIAEHGHVIDAPGLRPEHYDVFDCAMGERSIKPMGHIRMMAAAQPFLSGAISKTVNMPESATVDDIADMYFQGWKLGLKAIAVYRDNCKVGQPLSDGRGKHKEVPAQESAPAQLARPVRTRLPKSRPSLTTSFTVGGAEGYMTAGSYPDDGLGEVFLKLGKQGSTLAGVMDAFSMAISISLQYGVPLETYVQKFTNMKFEPAGLTDDPDVRMSQSIMDYIFRRLALDHLPFERRAALGIYTAEERQRQLETGSYEEITEDDGEVPEAEALKADSPMASAVKADASVDAPEPVAETARPAPAAAHTTAELLEEITGASVDAPLCFTCGTKMRPAGSCFVCEGCGSTSGCS